MNVELRELQLAEGADIWEMIREIGKGENGFENSLFTESEEAFEAGIHRNFEIARSVNLPPNYVPQTIYWLYADGVPVGYGKLRHRLNEHLEKHGGHIGYVIRPTARSNGNGTRILRELLKQAQKLGIEQVLLTCDETNIASRKIIEGNGGQLADIENGICRYWIDNSIPIE